MLKNDNAGTNFRRLEVVDPNNIRQFALLCEIPEELFPDPFFRELGELTLGILRVLKAGVRGDEYAILQAQSIRVAVFARDLNIGKNQLNEIIHWRTLARSRAHSHLWCMLTALISDVMFPGEPVESHYNKRGKLKRKVTSDTDLSNFIYKSWKTGKVNTPKSVGYEMYSMLLMQKEINPIDKRELANGLIDHLNDLPLEKCHYGCAEILRKEGLDISSVLNLD